ncbi:hypothetical protein CAPTEDRAFT_207919 [Capitella teleta]|uniref:Uncharacterized protein n=1 Tax=Capitella teleta TaxID=283909 RepID=R7VKR6_CAPTE|nr:hypothetical protein CAPTEDRAFT_207919 [Capitella teleta]|eukprot:ELU17606.1 hypothetical protein CAPTEDRAFT_207919 [Capitella teleta]
MERIQVNRFSFRRKNSSRNKNKEREQLVDYDYERMSYLSEILDSFKPTICRKSRRSEAQPQRPCCRNRGFVSSGVDFIAFVTGGLVWVSLALAMCHLPTIESRGYPFLSDWIRFPQSL